MTVGQGCRLGLDVSVSRRSQDVISNVSVSSQTENQTSPSRLGLVSVSHHQVSFTSRPIYIFIVFSLTLKRVQFYIRFIKYFPYARSLEGIVLTFYLFNKIKIKFALLLYEACTTHLRNIRHLIY